MRCADSSPAGVPTGGGIGGGGARAVDISVDIVIKKARDLRDRIHEIIDKVIKSKWWQKKKRATRIEFWSEGLLIGGPDMANETQLHNNKKKNIELLFKDDAGVERPVDGRPDIKGPKPEGICEIQIADDALSFMLFGKNPNSESPGIVGDVVVTVTADVDKGEGFKPLTEELTVHVVEPEAPQATDIEFKAGDEEDL